MRYIHFDSLNSLVNHREREFADKQWVHAISVFYKRWPWAKQKNAAPINSSGRDALLHLHKNTIDSRFHSNAMHFHRTLFINWLLPGSPIFHSIFSVSVGAAIFPLSRTQYPSEWVILRRVAPSDYCILHNIKFFPLAHGRIEFEWSELHTCDPRTV